MRRCFNSGVLKFLVETKIDKAMNKITEGNSEKVFTAITMILSFIIAIALFMILPFYLANLLKTFVRNDSLRSEERRVGKEC